MQAVEARSVDPRVRYPVPPPDLPDEVRDWLPTFFIVGAPKAGTTSLHNYLDAHPEIAMSTSKEPRCFVPPDWLERIAGYRDLFQRPAPVRGESSTAYGSFPWAAQVADRIKATVPEARIIYLVRDPIPRTLSHYAQNVWDGRAWGSFDDVVDDLEHPMNMSVWCSRYATQVERWIERFGRERVLILDHRDLLDRRLPTLRLVLEFLEVDPDFSSPDWDAEHNVAEEHRVPTALAERLGPVGGAAMRIPLLRRRLLRPVPTPIPTADQRARLSEFLAPELERLRALTGRSFSDWSV